MLLQCAAYVAVRFAYALLARTLARTNANQPIAHYGTLGGISETSAFDQELPFLQTVNSIIFISMH